MRELWPIRNRPLDRIHGYKTFSFEKIVTKDPLWVGRVAAVVGGALTSRGSTKLREVGTLSG